MPVGVSSLLVFLQQFCSVVVVVFLARVCYGAFVSHHSKLQSWKARGEELATQKKNADARAQEAYAEVLKMRQAYSGGSQWSESELLTLHMHTSNVATVDGFMA